MFACTCFHQDPKLFVKVEVDFVTSRLKVRVVKR